MSFFDVAGILVVLAAAFAFINHKVLKLPTTVGLMLLAMLHAVALLLIDLGRAIGGGADRRQRRSSRSIDFDQTLMQGMLGYLLFAGALHVNLNDLKEQTAVIALLATVGVLATTFLVGGLTYVITGWLGIEIRFHVLPDLRLDRRAHRPDRSLGDRQEPGRPQVTRNQESRASHCSTMAWAWWCLLRC